MSQVILAPFPTVCAVVFLSVCVCVSGEASVCVCVLICDKYKKSVREQTRNVSIRCTTDVEFSQVYTARRCGWYLKEWEKKGVG